MEKSPKAVALKYDRKKDRAPHVIAKGRGEIAKKIIEMSKMIDITSAHRSGRDHKLIPKASSHRMLWA